MRRRSLVDTQLEQWAHVRRELLGLRSPALARQFLGAVRCPLGERRDLHAGSRSEGRIEQSWPEFPYTGDCYVVNQAIKNLSPDLRTIADVNWAISWPRSRALRARMLGISTRAYWDKVGRCKTYVDGFLTGQKSQNTAT